MGFKIIYTKNKNKRIKRGDIKKLSKIDRIDFLLQSKEIEEHYDYKPCSLSLIGWLILNTGFLILLWIAAFGSSELVKLSPILSIIVIMLRLLIAAFILEFIALLLLSLKRKKEFKQLVKEKFK